MFEFSTLKAVATIAAKKDIRYYLENVHVTRTHMVASDGHSMIVINADFTLPDDEESILIPVTAIKALSKKIPNKSDHNSWFYSKQSDRSAILEVVGQKEIIDTHNPGTFPNWEQVLNAHLGDTDKNDDWMYNWEYMDRMAKAFAAIVKSKNIYASYKIRHTSKSAIFTNENVTGIVMGIKVD